MAEKFKKIFISELDEAYNKVLNWFFSFPNAEMSLNDLSKELKISKTTATKIIKRLVEEGFINKKVYGKTWRITCNQFHPYNHTHKVAYNLSMIYDAYEEVLREQIHKLVGNPKSIILFGSYRKGDDNENSDIDIAVEVQNNKSVEIIGLGVFEVFGYRSNVPINLHVFSRDKIDLNLFSNIANGIVLEGFLEVKP